MSRRDAEDHADGVRYFAALPLVVPATGRARKPEGEDSVKHPRSIVVAALVAGLMTATTGTAVASFPGQSTVAFVRYNGSDYRVIEMRPNGTEEHRVLGPESKAAFSSAAMSPDGRRAAISIYDGSQYDLWTKRLDGNLRQVTDTPNRNEYSPTWTPDGDTIVFMESDGVSYAAIVRRDADGSRRRQIYWTDQDFLMYPTVSPDGDRVLFSAPRLGEPTRGIADYDLVTMRLDGTGRRWLTDDDTKDQIAGDWSPDGQRVAFLIAQTLKPRPAFGGGLATGTPTPAGTAPVQPVYSMSADGGGRRLITEKPGIVGRVLYTPDGSRVMFARFSSVSMDLYSTPVDGGVLKPLTETVKTYNSFDLFGLPA